MRANRTQLKTLILAMALVFAGCAARNPFSSGPSGDQATGTLTPQAMEAAFNKMSKTTQQHEIFKQLVGDWRVVSKWWMDPSKEPQIEKGHAVKTLLFGGKFLKEEYQGKWLGKKFNGIGFTGYDTIASRFDAVWLDSMSTAIMATQGSLDSTGKVLTFNGEVSCPMSESGVRHMRTVLRIQDRSHHVFEAYSTGPDGREFKGLEITYTRSTPKKVP